VTDYATPAPAPAIGVEALDTVVELLARVEDDASSDAFFGRLCEATCRVGGMDRAVIFRYDEARRRVRASGGFGIALDSFAGLHVTVESAPIAKRALEEDSVIEVDAHAAVHELPERYEGLLREDATLVCVPISAAGRWSGVILCDRAPAQPLAGGERHLLWTLGKVAALATGARAATVQQQRARMLQERIDLAREIHESVIQRLFGVMMAFSIEAELPRDARERIVTELQAALRDLRRALQRPLGRPSPETQTTLKEEIVRLRREHPDLGLALAPGSAGTSVPRQLEPLAQSVLAEAVRNAHKHAQPSKVEVLIDRSDGVWVLEVSNDGVTGRPKRTGMGLRLAALEALQAGGLVEFGEREPGTWRVRLAVPLERD
jgi:signal transduction histidine kinase